MILKYDENEFRIKLGVSTVGFKEKPKGNEIIRMRYKREELSINEFSEKIRSGYNFTHNYNTIGDEYGLKEKTIQNFSFTNFIWIDVDKSNMDVNTTFNKLTNKPTITYTTMSNTDVCFRFRFVYVLDFSIKDNNEYREYLNLIVNDLLNDLGSDFLECIDRSCWNVSTQMYGSKLDCILFTDENLIYTKKSLENIKSKLEVKDLVDKCGKDLVYLKKEERGIYNENTENPALNDLCKMVLENYKSEFNYTQYLSNVNSAMISSDDMYVNIIDQNIYELNMYYPKGTKVPLGKRHKVLFLHGIIIRNITPEITILNLATTLYFLYKRNYTYSSDLGLYDICKVSENVMLLDLNDDKVKRTGKRKYIFNKTVGGYETITKQQKLIGFGLARRRTRDTTVLSNYDCNKSVIENARDLNVSPSTIYNSLKDNNVNTNNDNKYVNFVELYNSNPTIRSVRKLAKLVGISEKTVQKYKRRIESEIKDDDDFENYI